MVFLCGLTSDMEGTKALHLEAWAQRRGQAFLRFDYSGHGESSGDFADGAVGDWAEDAEAAVSTLAGGPAILVGSSLGGWIALLLARRRPELVAGMVTIAAAPDFTEDMMWAGFDEAQRRELEQAGRITVPSDYEDDYLITRRLIEEGRENLVLRAPLSLPFPARFLQGTADVDVPPAVAVRLLDHAEGPDMRLCHGQGGGSPLLGSRLPRADRGLGRGGAGAALGGAQAPPSGMRVDEVEHQRAYAAPPRASSENAVMPGLGLEMAGLHRFGQAAQQAMRGDALAGGRDVVAPALDGHDRHLRNRPGVDRTAADRKPVVGDLATLEDALDGGEVELRRHVHDGEILVVEPVVAHRDRRSSPRAARPI